jgi:hypothetical protein
MITLGDRSGRSDNSKPENRFKDHVYGPPIRSTVEWKTRRLTNVSSKSLRSHREIAFLTHLQHSGPKMVTVFNRPAVLPTGNVGLASNQD